MSLRKIIATLVVVGACYGSVEAGRHFIPKLVPAKIEAKYRTRSIGNPKAPLWIIEYLDFQCQECRMARTILDGYLKNHPREIYLQIRYYPLIHNHVYALKSAIYADCAAQGGRFWDFSKSLFEAQEQWAVSKDPDSHFLNLAKKSGLDPKALQACVDKPEVKASVLAERSEGRSLDIKMTPTFFMNGTKIEGLQAMKTELERYFSVKEKLGKI